MKIIRNDLNLLRAIAIIAVVGYHMKIPGFSNGFIGVDIFFFLSGFLMNSSVTKHLDNNTFSIKEFYGNRIKRIFPVYFSLLLVFFFVLFILFEIKFFEYSKSALTSSLFVSNIYYYLISGYFQPKSELNFLLHTWSLSLEVQFYFIFPFLAIFISKFTTNRYKISMWIFLIIVSMLFMWKYSSINSSFNFYLLPSRLWEFLVGVLLFQLPKLNDDKFSIEVKNSILIILLTFLFLIITSDTLIDPSTWPNKNSIWIILICGLITLVHPKKIRFNNIIQGIANRSFSIYLWHWPIIVIAHHLNMNSSIVQKIILIIIICLISEISFWLIEQKFKKSSLKAALIYTISSVILFHIPVIYLRGYINRIEKPNNLIDFYLSYPKKFTYNQFGFKNTHLKYNEEFHTYSKTNKIKSKSVAEKTYLLIGDCYAAMFSKTLEKLSSNYNINFITITADEVFPSQQSTSIYSGPKDLMNWVYSEFIPNNKFKIDKVILMANYSGYKKSEVIEGIKSNKEFFRKHELPYIYIGQTEKYSIDYPVLVWLQMKYSINIDQYLVPSRELVNDYLKTHIPSKLYLDIYKLKNITLSNKISSYIYDTEHLSLFGTEQYRKVLFQIFDDELYPN